MKILVGFAFAALAACGLSLAISSNAPDRPPGIAADRWASISDTLGVVLIPDSGVAVDPPPVGGVPPDLGANQTRGGAPYVEQTTTLIAPPSAAVQAIIEEGHPVRGYIMVKRGKLWRPLTMVAPSVKD